MISKACRNMPWCSNHWRRDKANYAPLKWFLDLRQKLKNYAGKMTWLLKIYSRSTVGAGIAYQEMCVNGK